MVLDPNGQLIDTWSGPDISGPWGNMAVVDHDTKASLFVSMAGFDVPAPSVRDPNSGYPVTLHKATVLRIDLEYPRARHRDQHKTVIGSGFAHRSDKSSFLVGPTGLAIAPDNTLYVSDALENRIVAIPDATTRKPAPEPAGRYQGRPAATRCRWSMPRTGTCCPAMA